MGLADMLVGSALQGAQNTGAGLANSVHQGANLALEAEKIQQNAMKLQQDKEQLQSAKYEKFMTALQHGMKFEGQGRSNYMKSMKTYRDSLGLTNDFPDEQLSFWTSTPEIMARMNTIIAQVRDGKLSEEQGVAMFQDITTAGDVPPEVMDEQTTKLAAAGTTQVNANAQAARQKTDIESTGQKALATRSAATFDAYNNQGGRAGLDKNIQKYQEAIATLKSGKVKFGTFGKKVPWGSDEDVLARLDPAAKALVDDVRGGVNMRAALADPNPTEKQISQLLGRTIDPRLDNAANIKKLEDSIKAMQQEASTKEAEFQKQGFMSTAPAGAGAQASGARNIHELDDDAKAQQVAAKLQQNPALLPVLAQRYGVTPRQLQRILGIQGGQ